MNEQKQTNPYGICNVAPGSDCANCPVNEQLFCHYKARDTLRFGLLISPVFAVNLIGLAR